MKTIRLFDWDDKDKQSAVREIAVVKTDNLTRNGKERIYVWTGDGEDANYTLYPQYGTAYPEFDNRVQEQRIAVRYLYETVE